MTLSVQGLSKKYCQSLRRSLRYGVTDIARELLPRRARETGLRDGEFWALDDVSFELGRGESLAVVGRNGAGKSTLLKVLYGLLKPDRGEVRVRGHAEALIELGTGINPLLTGRENVRAGAALRGLSRRQADELVERVLDFTELADFFDAPVQSYSTGMKARLSYGLNAHLQPDVLLVDEVLAVGDIAFQRKCAAHMRAYLDRGGSLLLVSHNTWHIQSVCERGILLDRGRLTFSGTAVEAVNTLLHQRAEESTVPAVPHGPFTIEELRSDPFDAGTGEPLRITLRYRATERAEVWWGFSIWTPDQWVCVAGEYDMTPRMLGPGEGELTCLIPRLPLVGGRYALRAGIVDAATRHPLALYGWDGPAAVLDVRSKAGLQSNMQMTLQQLITMDVEW
jgi:ABC-type polysaccharide/polyol phosphate transport system ATPase subunit